MYVYVSIYRCNSNVHTSNVFDVYVSDTQNLSAKPKKGVLGAVKNIATSHVIKKYLAYTVNY